MDSPPSAFPGLYLAAIGDNWEIYLNGVLVRREMHRDDKGRIREHHSQRSVFFHLDRALLNWGNNLLVFRIVGDPTDQTVGFQYSAPYYLSDYEYIRDKNSEILVMFLVGIFVLAGIYHFLIFALNRQSSYNGFCGIFALFMGLYYLSRTHNIYQFIPDTWIVVKLEFFFIFLVIPALGAYTETLCLGSIQRITKIYSCLFAFLAVSQLFFVHSYGSDALIVWQILGIAALLWILVHNILLPFVGEVRAGKKLGAAVWDTYPGNLLLGVSLFILSAVADIINALFFHYPQGFNRYTLSVFVLTMAVMLTRLYSRLNRELAEKSALLENAENPDTAREAVFSANDLTDREKEVARLIVKGFSNAEIADRLFVSESSISFHITNIYRKFGTAGKISGRKSFLAKLMSASIRSD
jgi:DNA-binding CsgD family transcriptional regulator